MLLDTYKNEDYIVSVERRRIEVPEGFSQKNFDHLVIKIEANPFKKFQQVEIELLVRGRRDTHQFPCVERHQWEGVVPATIVSRQASVWAKQDIFPALVGGVCGLVDKAALLKIAVDGNVLKDEPVPPKILDAGGLEKSTRRQNFLHYLVRRARKLFRSP